MQISKGQQITAGLSHNTYMLRMSRFDEWETKLLTRMQTKGDGDCLILLGAKSSNGYGMIRVKLGGELEHSKGIGVHWTVVLTADLQVSHLCHKNAADAPIQISFVCRLYFIVWFYFNLLSLGYSHLLPLLLRQRLSANSNSYPHEKLWASDKRPIDWKG